ncbi:transcriptional regulator [Salmonella enterica]|nr:transcriptional regulator [Salmonella enterica]
MIIIVNHWRLDTRLGSLIHTKTGEMRRLGEYQFLLLQTLANHADEVLSHQFLMSEVWATRVVGRGSLPAAIHSLRTALDDDSKQRIIIKTIPKKGYMLNSDFLIIHQDNGDQPVISEGNVKEIVSVDPWPKQYKEVPAKVLRKWLAMASFFALLVICFWYIIYFLQILTW